jgi:single-stranded-DNA-specific exonuclease
VTDHHLPQDEELADAILVNPRQPRCLYPFPDLAGVGIALKLALALLEKCEREVELESLLRIACLGTIADLAPLVGENRTIAALGLRALGASRAPGLQALFRGARLTPPLSAEDVAFRIAPRLNAAGRLSSSDLALELLLTRDARRAADLAGQLEQLNRERQDEERRACDEAREQFMARSPLPPILVGWSATWHRGVVGIAAGRLARELNRPVVLLAIEGDVATGSGRSAAGIALHEFLSGWRSRLVRFGGHAQAIGLAARIDDLAPLRDEWEAAAEAWSAEVSAPAHRFELSLTPRAVTLDLLADLERLAPHGHGNPQPLTRVGPLRVVEISAPFGRGHLRARAVDPEGGPALDLLGWGWGDRCEDLRAAREALGYLERDRYRAVPVLRLVDVRGEDAPTGGSLGAGEDPATV